MRKPTKKFWNKNEKTTLSKLGLKLTPASGAGEVHKEDGYNEYVLSQLKSTVRDSVSVKRRDVETLIYNANMVRKIPVFVIQFLDGYTLVATLPDQLENIGKYLNGEQPTLVGSDLSLKTVAEGRKPTIRPSTLRRKEEKQAPSSIAEIKERRKK